MENLDPKLTRQILRYIENKYDELTDDPVALKGETDFIEANGFETDDPEKFIRHVLRLEKEGLIHIKSEADVVGGLPPVVFAGGLTYRGRNVLDEQG